METLSVLLAFSENDPLMIGGFPSQMANDIKIDVSLLLASMSCWKNSRVMSELRRHAANVTLYNHTSFRAPLVNKNALNHL